MPKEVVWQTTVKKLILQKHNMLSLLKAFNRHYGKMLTATPVQSNDNEKFDKSGATKHRKVRQQNSGKLLTIWT
jgi:hypothetical protein